MYYFSKVLLRLNNLKLKEKWCNVSYISCFCLLGMIMISQYFTTQRSLATGIVMSGGAAGALVQTRLHQYLIRTVGWRQSMRIFAGIMGISVVAGFAYKPLNPPGTVHAQFKVAFTDSSFIAYLIKWSPTENEPYIVEVCGSMYITLAFYMNQKNCLSRVHRVK